MTDYIPLSVLNDFVFCPYSIYLHQVYMEADEDVYKAAPQTRGTVAHEPVDRKTSSTRRGELLSLPVYSDTLGIAGKIDVYKTGECRLIERKYNLKQIFRGHYYQLWGQYYCMTEMGYEVRELAFYEISSRRLIPVPLPGSAERDEMERFVRSVRAFNPYSDPIPLNPNKCRHCIYCNLCDKTELNNVYT